jgi:hypothetical protein
MTKEEQLMAEILRTAERWTSDNSEASESKPLLQPVSVFDVLTSPSPPPAFVWDGYLPRGVVSLLSAHGGVGKSTIALMMGVAAAAGRNLFGVGVEPCAALYLSLEDGTGIVRHRLAGICRAWNINPRELDRLHIVDGTGHPELFTADHRGAGETTRTFAELRELVRKFGAGLIVVDNASDGFGGDEIQRRQVRAFMRALVEIARETDAAVLLLAHVDKLTSRARKAEGGEGYSGSTAWHNSARSRLFLSRSEHGDLRLEHQKSNLGKLQEPLTLTWPDGALPMLAADAPNFDGLNARAEGRAQDSKAAALLRLLAEFESREQFCSPIATARNNVFATLRSEPAFQALKLNADGCRRIVNQAQRAGWIEVSEYRTLDRKNRQKWTVTEAGRCFAGLSAPSAPSAPSCSVSEEGAESAGGAPSAPSCVGGVGESARTNESAEDGLEADLH